MSQGCNFLWPFERQVSRIRHNSKPWDEQLAPRKMPSRMCRESPAAALLWRRKGPRPPAGRSWERTDTHPNEHISEQPGGGQGAVLWGRAAVEKSEGAVCALAWQDPVGTVNEVSRFQGETVWHDLMV